MTTLRLLLLDANVVIELFRLGVWERVIGRCQISLARTIVEVEAHFYVNAANGRVDFDLRPFAAKGQITVFDVMPSKVQALLTSFDPTYVEKLDPGEVESLCHLLDAPEVLTISSADKIVYRVLGNLDRGEQGISLEEILQSIGLGRSLQYQFTKAFRERWTQKGFEERLYSRGRKP